MQCHSASRFTGIGAQEQVQRTVPGSSNTHQSEQKRSRLWSNCRKSRPGCSSVHSLNRGKHLVSFVASAVSTARGPDRRQQAKYDLLSSIAGTDRGSAASSWQRALVAEAQVEVESFGSFGIARLEGLWRLIYTIANDVRPLVATSFSPLSFFQVGDIYQKFSSPEEGRVQNIIKLSVAGLTVPDRGVTFTVDATYEVRSDSRVALFFEAASIGELHISPALEAVLAPALLPRTWLNQQLLLALQQLNIRVPLTTPSQMRRQGSNSSGSDQRRGFGEYLLSYIDDDMLIGRASQGCFIFQREM